MVSITIMFDMDKEMNYNSKTAKKPTRLHGTYIFPFSLILKVIFAEILSLRSPEGCYSKTNFSLQNLEFL